MQDFLDVMLFVVLGSYIVLLPLSFGQSGKVQRDHALRAARTLRVEPQAKWYRLGQAHGLTSLRDQVLRRQLAPTAAAKQRGYVTL